MGLVTKFNDTGSRDETVYENQRYCHRDSGHCTWNRRIAGFGPLAISSKEIEDRLVEDTREQRGGSEIFWGVSRGSPRQYSTILVVDIGHALRRNFGVAGRLRLRCWFQSLVHSEYRQ